MIRLSDAIAAYSAAAKAPVATTETDAAAPGSDFASMVKDAAQDAIGSAKEAESLSKAALAGKASLRDVVTAVNNAELTLETVVSIRDKVINAYNDIIKMPI
jgi:flagellar hook-basal body complex protein FliE